MGLFELQHRCNEGCDVQVKNRHSALANPASWLLVQVPESQLLAYPLIDQNICVTDMAMERMPHYARRVRVAPNAIVRPVKKGVQNEVSSR
jgi:hypothetical protein